MVGTILAYIDPGTGALVLQVVAAGVLTCGILFRKALLFPIAALSSVFRRKDRASSSSTATKSE